MRNVRFVLITIVLLSFTHLLYAQSKAKASNQVYQDGSKYHYMNKTYSYKELGPLFQDSQEFGVLHRKAMKNQTLATIFGTATIGMGIWAISIGNNCEDLGCLGVYVPALIGAVTGTVSLIQINTATRSKKNSLILLNNTLRSTSLESNGGASLSISASVNGMGIFYRF